MSTPPSSATDTCEWPGVGDVEAHLVVGGGRERGERVKAQKSKSAGQEDAVVVEVPIVHVVAR
jgi:hypothetical protein